MLQLLRKINNASWRVDIYIFFYLVEGYSVFVTMIFCASECFGMLYIPLTHMFMAVLLVHCSTSNTPLQVWLQVLPPTKNLRKTQHPPQQPLQTHGPYGSLNPKQTKSMEKPPKTKQKQTQNMEKNINLLKKQANRPKRRR